LTAGRKVRVKKLDLKGTRRAIKEGATEKALQVFYEILVEKVGLKT
jgi:hypothetical protein